MDVFLLQGDNEPQGMESGCSVSYENQKDEQTAELTTEELLPTALSFYELQHTHIIHEEDPDTKVQSHPIPIPSSAKNAVFVWPLFGRSGQGQEPLVQSGGGGSRAFCRILHPYLSASDVCWWHVIRCSLPGMTAPLLWPSEAPQASRTSCMISRQESEQLLMTQSNEHQNKSNWQADFP